MYQITPTNYGFKVRSSGSFSADEVLRLRRDLLHAIEKRGGPFSLVIDSRTLVLPTGEIRDQFFDLHAAVWRAGCIRVAFVIMSPVAKHQVRQMHFSAAPEGNDRVIEAAVIENWEEVATAWVTDAVEPPAFTVDQVDVVR